MRLPANAYDPLDCAVAGLLCFALPIVGLCYLLRALALKLIPRRVREWRRQFGVWTLTGPSTHYIKE